MGEQPLEEVIGLEGIADSGNERLCCCHLERDILTARRGGKNILHCLTGCDYGGLVSPRNHKSTQPSGVACTCCSGHSTLILHILPLEYVRLKK